VEKKKSGPTPKNAGGITKKTIQSKVFPKSQGENPEKKKASHTNNTLNEQDRKEYESGESPSSAGTDTKKPRLKPPVNLKKKKREDP